MIAGASREPKLRTTTSSGGTEVRVSTSDGDSDDDGVNGAEYENDAGAVNARWGRSRPGRGGTTVGDTKESIVL